MRLTRLLTATIALVALISAPAMAVDPSELRAQVKANHLTAKEARSLQAQVDKEVARTNGTQVAINQVQWAGGDTLIPLPGEARARELGAAPKARAIYGCNYLQFCLYRYNFQGMVARMTSCTYHDVRSKYFTSYVNNQTRGTRARFYDHLLNRLSWTKPAPATGTTSLGLRTAYVRPC